MTEIPTEIDPPHQTSQSTEADPAETAPAEEPLPVEYDRPYLASIGLISLAGARRKNDVPSKYGAG
ncbi:MAG TPA: hypothetical protein VFW90_00575 [Candidatus Saccharimonadales bacterium]|nr:hypothetical protein [Candidatus Saccharimonadales bacterium]